MNNQFRVDLYAQGGRSEVKKKKSELERKEKKTKTKTGRKRIIAKGTRKKKNWKGKRRAKWKKVFLYIKYRYKRRNEESNEVTLIYIIMLFTFNHQFGNLQMFLTPTFNHQMNEQIWESAWSVVLGLTTIARCCRRDYIYIYIYIYIYTYIYTIYIYTYIYIHIIYI